MKIRDAVAEDAEAACKVLRRSIAELCYADHRDDPTILSRWLRNKRPEFFLSWLAQPNNSVLVAVDDGRVVAVGSVTDAGRINLNYVSPDARFRGVSRALLGALEARAVERGNTRCTLISTETAHRFYRARGYSEEGPPTGEFGTNAGYPMAKLLNRNHADDDSIQLEPARPCGGDRTLEMGGVLSRYANLRGRIESSSPDIRHGPRNPAHAGFACG